MRDHGEGERKPSGGKKVAKTEIYLYIGRREKETRRRRQYSDQSCKMVMVR